jgi:hypothetical protein
MSSSIAELEKRVAKPSSMTSNSGFGRDINSLVFYSLLRSDRVIDLEYEVENDNNFCVFYKRYRDKLRKMVAKCISEVGINV